VFDRWLYARFAGYLPVADLSLRANKLYTKGYSYHRCVAPGSSSTVQLEEGIMNYDGCTAPASGESLSPDDFFLDINLILGIPAPIADQYNPGGGWQAWQFSSFASMSDQNCTGVYGDGPGLSVGFWAWGFWAGNFPYVSHSDLGYDPLGSGPTSKWLAEFGVERTVGEVLPAFAFSMMPKMIPMISPGKLGQTFPFFVMGMELDVKKIAGDAIGLTVIQGSTYLFLAGGGSLYVFTYYADAIYISRFALGIYLITYAFFPILLIGLYRFKADQS